MSKLPRSSPPARRPGNCGESDEDHFDSYEDIVADYLECLAPNANTERMSFRNLGSLKEVIEHATLDGRLKEGGEWVRHFHQRRIPADALAKANEKLQVVWAEIQDCTSFDDLHALVRREIDPIPGIGKLVVYDVAIRIGASRIMRLEPKFVYLHAGTREGAKALGLDVRRDVIDPTEFPKPFQRLRPDDIESCLCCYKDDLKRIKDSMGKRRLVVSHH